MNELAFFERHSKGGTLTSELLRDTLDFSKPTLADGVLFSWRWHFFLGTLPLPPHGDLHVAECHRSCELWTQQWLAAGRRLAMTWREVPEQKTKPVKFDETSSSSSDSRDGEDGCTMRPSIGLPAAPSTAKSPVNPLLPPLGSSYALQFQVDALRQSVANDMNRLFWGAPPFDDPQTKVAVSDILLKYCLMENREYKQGFHELVAFLYYACHRDKVVVNQLVHEHPSLQSSPLVGLFEQVYADLSAAVLALFRKIVDEDGKGMHLNQWYSARDHDKQSGVVLACERVQQYLLSQIDPELHHLLTVQYDIQSVMYLVRWLRLLFLREVPLEQALRVWTAIFCERYAQEELNRSDFVLDESLSLYVATQMLRNIRQVLAVDSAEAIRHLMKYPPIRDVGALLYAAIVSNKASTLSSFVTAPLAETSSDGLLLPTMATEEQQVALSQALRGDKPQSGREAPSSPAEREWWTEMYTSSVAQLKSMRDVILSGVPP